MLRLMPSLTLLLIGAVCLPFMKSISLVFMVVAVLFGLLAFWNHKVRNTPRRATNALKNNRFT
jgi:hypothetical protein